MFLELAHTKLDIFNVAKKFVLLCYKETKNFPSDEKFAMTSQIRRASLSVYLNIAEGCSRKSVTERKRFYEISRGSLIEVECGTGYCCCFRLPLQRKATGIRGINHPCFPPHFKNDYFIKK